MLNQFVQWLPGAVVQVGAALGLSIPFFLWFGKRWIDHKLAMRLKAFEGDRQEELATLKTEQQRELDQIKAGQNTVLERLRFLLTSRISKIHDKEFEVLPQAWLMLNDLHGSVALALGLTVTYYPDFVGWSDQKFEVFLTQKPASDLADNQKEELRNASDREKYFREAMEGLNLHQAEIKEQQLRNYLIQHRIFMDDDLRGKFSTVHSLLKGALISYDIGKDANDSEMVHSAYKDVMELEDKVNAVEQAVQKRLRYEEA